MVAIFIVAIFHTFNNVANLLFSAKPSVAAQGVFAGEESRCDIHVASYKCSTHYNVIVRWPGGRPQSFDLIEVQKMPVALLFKTQHRGMNNPGRLLVECYFPLGLLRCWTWLDLNTRVLAYPKPRNLVAPDQTDIALGQGSVAGAAGSEDFHGLNDYQPGHSLKHVAWKHYARGKGLYVKTYVDYQSKKTYLDWHSLSALNSEARLSQLCFWALQLGKTTQAYGLRLPDINILPSSGSAHQHNVLRSLALFESTGANQKNTAINPAINTDISNNGRGDVN